MDQANKPIHSENALNAKERQDKQMINYAVIRKNTENSEPVEHNTYGICACRVGDGLLEIIKCVWGISDDVAWLRALVDKLNRYDADPIHLCDIIEDELYDMKA